MFIRKLLRTQRFLLVLTYLFVPAMSFFLPWLQSRYAPGTCRYYDTLSETTTRLSLAAENSPATKAAHKPSVKKRFQRKKGGFNKMYTRLADYYNTHGHTNVSKEDKDLYRWVVMLRNRYGWQVRKDVKSRATKLSDERLRMLQDVKFQWKTKTAFRRQRFEQMYPRLLKYYEKHGQSDVTRKEDPELQLWVKKIRSRYGWQIRKDRKSRHNAHRLSREKLQMLNKVDFQWKTKREPRLQRFEDMYPQLVQFYEEHGHSDVTREDDADLERWVKNIRSRYGWQLREDPRPRRFAHRLSQEKLNMLQYVEFQWKTKRKNRDSKSVKRKKALRHEKASWLESYNELCEYWRKHGHHRPTVAENKKLHYFVRNQRQNYRKYMRGEACFMSPDRIEKLEKIEFDWGQNFDTLWEQRYEELKAYYKKYGNSHVPQHCAEYPRLGRWTMNQRSNYNRNNLNQERIEKLEKLDFEWHIREMKWKNMWNRLKEYQEKHGHLKIPTSDKENDDLRLWLNEMRSIYNRGHTTRLSEERKKLMESIPGFQWRRRLPSGKPSKSEWEDLLEEIRKRGIRPEVRAKKHWFDGIDRFADVKTEYSEQELLALWNEEDDEDEDGDEEYLDEESRHFLTS